MTDPEKDLLLSILALDSYNRGYDDIGQETVAL